jgi:hypothetical protein
MTAVSAHLIAVDDNHPAALAFHSINNAAQIAVLLPDEGIDDAGDRIVELLTDAGMHVADLNALLDKSQRAIEELRGDVKLRDGLIAALEDDKRELLEDGMRQAMTIARLEAMDTEKTQRLIAAEREVEEITRCAAAALEDVTVLFNRCNGARIRRGGPARPLGVRRAEQCVG